MLKIEDKFVIDGIPFRSDAKSSQFAHLLIGKNVDVSIVKNTKAVGFEVIGWLDIAINVDDNADIYMYGTFFNEEFTQQQLNVLFEKLLLRIGLASNLSYYCKCALGSRIICFNRGYASDIIY
jgi:hypothetical protein